MPEENTIATSNQTYFADEKIEIPETTNVSYFFLNKCFAHFMYKFFTKHGNTDDYIIYNYFRIK